MKFKKILATVLSGVLALSVVGCGSKGDASSNDDKKIVVGATAVPHAEILEHIKPLLEEKGYELEVKTFDDYSLLNPAVDEGSLDANFFQHVPYLEESIEAKGYDLDYTVKVHIEPMALYSKKVSDISEIADGAEIAVPNDPSNEARALKLLADNGLIELNDSELPTVKDITKNPKNLKVTELQAEQLPRVLEDVEAAVINTNWALQADLNPVKDSLAIESGDSPYANVLAVKKENKDSDKIKALSDALTSEEVRKFIEEKYDGSVIPAF
ncbi:MetQ/NlpA family ABC transporter substrate-binding protein [uncultured Clostridium sp.]|uniref:MetQ/NlpA family ABC transporter substrate-binding protein n=1 Tax=uncultured Clostridium sp. TaxID=59620 RepID=UPI0025EF1DD7|nr:MetQ/NlpA family ABC transporter substrate-binding protein [uncultured Clostridium sp.]